MRGADDAHVHGLFLRCAERADAALLNRAQQLGLHGQRQVADLVEEQRAALRRLKEAFAVGGRAGVRAFACAKEFGFEQIFGNRAAVHRDHRAVRALAATMQRARDQLLAGARFAAHQHGRHAARHLGDALLHIAHGFGFADQQTHDGRCRLGFVVCGDLGFRFLETLGGRCLAGSGNAAGPLHGRGHDRAELLEIDRLGQIVERACAQRLDGVFRRAVGRHHHAALAPLVLAQMQQHLHAVAVGQAHVADHHIELLHAQLLARFLHRTCGFDAVALAQQREFVERPQVGFIVDDKNGGGVCRHVFVGVSNHDCVKKRRRPRKLQ